MMRESVKKTGLLIIGILLIGAVFSVPARADSDETPPQQPTVFPTPTADVDGRIQYIIQKDDTFFRIAAIAGLTVEELYAMNGIQSGDLAIPGTILLLDIISTPTPMGSSEETQISPTPTPVFGVGEVCVFIFEDENGNARIETGESALAGAQISIASTDGEVVGEHTTDDAVEGHCFVDIGNGDYNVSAAVPDQFNPTTTMNLGFHLNAGDIKYIEFGAQRSGAISIGGDEVGDGRSTWMGVLGVVLLLAAAGVGTYAVRFSRRP